MSNNTPTHVWADEESEANTKRLIRIETKLSKLMQHFGLTAEGTPIPATAQRPTSYPTNTKENKQ